MSPEVARRRIKMLIGRGLISTQLNGLGTFFGGLLRFRRFGQDSSAAVEPGGRILEVLRGAVRGRSFAHVVLRPPRVDVSRIMRCPETIRGIVSILDS